MSKLKDLTGQKYGRLTVIERVGTSKSRQALWRCRCSCGNEIIILGESLRRGATQSCGCLRKELVVQKDTTHGMTHNKFFNTWCNIKRRCLDPHNIGYKNYGGRGITMYAPWINDFQAFYDYISKLEHFDEEGYTLDRKDNGGNYEPGNFRWADIKTQTRNKRNNVIVEYNGEKMTLAEAVEKSKVPLDTLRRRLKHGETGDYLFRLPKRHGNLK